MGPLPDPRPVAPEEPEAPVTAGPGARRARPFTVQKVMVPRAHRRTGLCTALLRDLVAAASPDPVRVQSVASPEMEALLRRLGATKDRALRRLHMVAALRVSNPKSGPHSGITVKSSS